jgi:hypothetical protein
VRDPGEGHAGLRYKGSWEDGESGSLAAQGPARLVALAGVVRGEARLELEATEGVTVGFGSVRFPAPIGAREAITVTTDGERDVLRVGDAIRIALPGEPGGGARPFSIDVPARARAHVSGLAIARE